MLFQRSYITPDQFSTLHKNWQKYHKTNETNNEYVLSMSSYFHQLNFMNNNYFSEYLLAMKNKKS